MIRPAGLLFALAACSISKPDLVGAICAKGDECLGLRCEKPFDGGASRCVACTDEVLDCQDNDCDGDIDEGLVAPACELQAGVCAGSIRRCGPGGLESPCAAVSYGAMWQAAEARLDGLDNDCDGTVNLSPETVLLDDVEQFSWTAVGASFAVVYAGDATPLSLQTFDAQLEAMGLPLQVSKAAKSVQHPRVVTADGASVAVGWWSTENMFSSILLVTRLTLDGGTVYGSIDGGIDGGIAQLGSPTNPDNVLPPALTFAPNTRYLAAVWVAPAQGLSTVQTRLLNPGGGQLVMPSLFDAGQGLSARFDVALRPGATEDFVLVFGAVDAGSTAMCTLTTGTSIPNCLRYAGQPAREVRVIFAGTQMVRVSNGHELGFGLSFDADAGAELVTNAPGPFAAVDVAGTSSSEIVVVWSDASSAGRLSYATRLDGGFGSTRDLTSPGVFATTPLAVADNRGALHVAYLKLASSGAITGQVVVRRVLTR